LRRDVRRADWHDLDLAAHGWVNYTEEWVDAARPKGHAELLALLDEAGVNVPGAGIRPGWGHREEHFGIQHRRATGRIFRLGDDQRGRRSAPQERDRVGLIGPDGPGDRGAL